MELSQKNIAVIAGLSLILMAILAGIGYGYAFNGFYIANDTITTIRNLNKFISLLKLTIASFSIILILDIIVTWSLFEFFKSFNNHFSSLIALFRLVYCAILCGSIFYLLSVLELIQNVSQNSEMIMFYLNMFLRTWSWGLIIFGCHLFLLGIMICESRVVPRVIGYFTGFAGFCYFFVNTGSLIIPSYQIYRELIENILAIPMALGELILAIWLIRFRYRNK